MKTNLNGIFGKLRKKNRQQYLLLAGCTFISVLLITALSVIMQSNTVQMILPEGGDSRKQMSMIFYLAVVGCGFLVIYASTLFFRYKSRETGIFMALGVVKKKITMMLLKELLFMTLVSAVLGVVLGTPLAIGIWNAFKLLLVDSPEMNFSLNLKGYIVPAIFTLFIVLALFVSIARFMKRTNIMDIVNTQRKTEQIKDVKSWYGIVGIVLIIVGGFSGYITPTLFVNQNLQPPAWAGLLYILALIGIYLILIYFIVRGGSKKSYYKNIITRSMMRFQGRQTVGNMCVIALLVIGAYFGCFYLPTVAMGGATINSWREYDYDFHYRADEEDMISFADIEKMAENENVVITDHQESEFAILASDGFVRDWLEDGTIANDHIDFLTEVKALSESNYNKITGQTADVKQGEYYLVAPKEYKQNYYGYNEQMTLFTNPLTKKQLEVTFSGRLTFHHAFEYVVIDDADYALATEGLTPEWYEKLVFFNVENSAETYNFAKQLKDELVSHSTDKSKIFDGYDFVEKMTADDNGEVYWGDDPERAFKIDYAEKDLGEFNRYWRYSPIFRVIEANDALLNLGVFMMVFVFMALICFIAVVIIAYTRSITVAVNNKQVYDDLKHLGANNKYIYSSLRSQISKIYGIPIAIGTIIISAYYTMLMYFNSGSFVTAEILALCVDVVIVAVFSFLLWLCYKFTLKKVCDIIGVKKVAK